MKDLLLPDMRRDRATAGANLLVQVIFVSWDKSGRGAPAAEQRNRIPLALPLPKSLAPDVGRHLLVHESHWDHTNGFEREIRSVVKALDVAAGYKFRCAAVRAVDEGVELEWTWSAWGGAPPRHARDADGNVVPETHRHVARENEWVRARSNGRFTDIDTGTWWYISVAINAGLCPTGQVPADFFLRSQPVDDYAQLAHLW